MERQAETIEPGENKTTRRVLFLCCPVFPGAERRLYWSFQDPSRAEGSEEERLEVFRKVRDEIQARISEELLTGDRP